MARRSNASAARRRPAARSSEQAARRSLGSMALDNPVATGGWLVMALTAALIVANAMSFQPGRHPAPLFSTRPLPSPGEDAGARVKTSAIVASALVKDLQVELRRLGIYEGPLDGLKGPATERAVRAYQRASGLADTGEIDEGLLARATLDTGAGVLAVPVPPQAPEVASAQPAAAPAPAVKSRQQQRIEQVQRLLSKLGYGPISIDGLVGAETAGAVRRFQLDRGLPITGEIDDRLLQELERISG